MVQQDDSQPEMLEAQQAAPSEVQSAQSADEILRTVTQDLKHLQTGLIAQLSHEVSCLQAEKARLIADIDRLQKHQQALQAGSVLPDPQIQQQAWAKQLAHMVAVQLQALLAPGMSQPARSSLAPPQTTNGSSEAASDRSSLAPGLRTTERPNASLQPTHPHPSGPRGNQDGLTDHTVLPSDQSTGPKGATVSPTALETAKFRLGFVLIALSTLVLSLHNVAVRVIGTKSTILNAFQLGGFLKLGLGNSLLILWMRMLIVLPLMIPVAMALYPNVWRDLREFLTHSSARHKYSVIGSGAFLFLSQILTYIAIGQVGPSIAVTVLFMFPIVTAVLAWILFNDRPSSFLWMIMGVISLGIVLAALPNIAESGVKSGAGIVTAIGAGIAFALYIVGTRLSTTQTKLITEKLHPVPVSIVQFSTIFLLSSLILILPIDLGVQVDQPSGFVIGGVVLGVLTLISYLSNNYGIALMGPTLAAIVGSSGPVVTALLAWVLIHSQLKSLTLAGISFPAQVLGIVLVTAGVVASGFEQRRKVQAAKQRASAQQPTR